MTSVFVVMPFGKKTDQGVTVDFDRVYAGLVVPACVALKWKCTRIDEVSFSGPISRQIIEFLTSADIVIADLTTANPNVYFELGIRQSLTERPTVLIARNGTQLPFDIHDQRVIFYNYSAVAFTPLEISKLSQTLQGADDKGIRSPILAHLRELGTLPSATDRAAFEADLRQKIGRATSLEQLLAVWHWASEQSPLPAHVLLELADRISNLGDWRNAAAIGARAVSERPSDFEVHRRYGWYLRNIGSDQYELAEEEFRRAIGLNAADPETLGMLGGLLKRLNRYEEAAKCYDAALRLSPTSLYIRVAHAGMTLLSELAKGESPRSGIDLYASLLTDVSSTEASRVDAWSFSVLGECAFVLGQKSKAKEFFETAARIATDPTMLMSPVDQLGLFGSHGFLSSDAAELADHVKTLLSSKDAHSLEKSLLPAAAIVSSRKKFPTIIHLSDIHFGVKKNKIGDKQTMHRFVANDYSQTLKEHLYAELVSPKGRFRLAGKPVTIVASGDFAYSATSEEFSEATKLFQFLRDELKLDSSHFVFCPGNHDVNWDLSTFERAQRFDPYLIFLRQFYGPSLFGQLYPLVTWDFGVASQRPDPSDLAAIHYDADRKALFVSFNSCVYETEQHHYGFISHPQQRKIASILEALNIPDDALRVAVVHHHLHPYPDFMKPLEAEHWLDMSTIRDGGLFERFLEKVGFDLVLHGHKHRPQLRETIVRDRYSQEPIKSLIVCGAGSCGVVQTELEHSTGNQFQVLEFVNDRRVAGSDFLRIEWRELAVHPGAEWATTRVWNVLGG